MLLIKSNRLNIKNIILVFGLFFIFYNPLFAQYNFVPNSSFENYSQCPHQWDEISFAIPWDTLKMGSCGVPELMSECDTIIGYCNVPFAFGYQYPKSGKSYINMFIYIDAPATFTPRRDYAQVKLKQNLTPGKLYCVTFFASLTNRSEIAITEIGAYLDDGSIHAPNLTWALATPQVQSPNGIYMNDTLNWMLVQGDFLATGNESYLTLGNFKDEVLTDTIHVKPLFIYTSAEYNVDDVSVLETNSKINGGNDTTILMGDTIELGKTNTEGLPCEWYDMAGNKIGRGSTALVHPTTNTKYVVRMDLCGFVSYDTINISIATGTDELSKDKKQVDIYPNPVSDNINIELSKENYTIVYSIKLYNYEGVEVMSKVSKGSTMINVSTLLSGFYLITVDDGTNVERRKISVIH